MSRHPFQWPSDIYLEFHQMNQATVLATLWKALLQLSTSSSSSTDHNTNNNNTVVVVEGLAVHPMTKQVVLTSVTAEQVWEMIHDNQDLFVHHHHHHLDSNDKNKNSLDDSILLLLRLLGPLHDVWQSNPNDTPPGAISIVAWSSNHTTTTTTNENNENNENETKDDPAQEETTPLLTQRSNSSTNTTHYGGMTYCIVRDSRHKCFTIVCLGGDDDGDQQVCISNRDNLLGGGQVTIPPPPTTTTTASSSSSNAPAVHAGLYRALFGDPKKNNNDTNTSLYGQMVQDLEPWLAAYPKYKVYVTGTPGVGAGLAQLVAFFLASAAETATATATMTTNNTTTTSSTTTTTTKIPKPISCLVLAAPRVGNASYLFWHQRLEQARCLRSCRLVVVDQSSSSSLDGRGGCCRGILSQPLSSSSSSSVSSKVQSQAQLWPYMPLMGFCHAGFQIKLILRSGGGGRHGNGDGDGDGDATIHPNQKTSTASSSTARPPPPPPRVQVTFPKWHDTDWSARFHRAWSNQGAPLRGLCVTTTTTTTTTTSATKQKKNASWMASLVIVLQYWQALQASKDSLLLLDLNELYTANSSPTEEQEEEDDDAAAAAAGGMGSYTGFVLAPLPVEPKVVEEPNVRESTSSSASSFSSSSKNGTETKKAAAAAAATTGPTFKPTSQWWW